jgi:hypothetical protein
VSLRKVVTEITIETNQFLVIKRRQVTRSKCSECASEAEFVRPEPDKVNILVDEQGTAWHRGIIQYPSLYRRADGSQATYPRSLLGAARLANGFLNCLRRGSKREGETLEENQRPEI